MPEGFDGFLDFVGYPVGGGIPVPPAGGFHGFLDFMGYPVGNVLVPGPGGFQGAGRRLMYHVLAAQRQQEVRMRQEAQARVLIHERLLESRWQSFEAAKRQILVTSMYSTLLSEV